MANGHPDPTDTAAGDDYFNDLTQQPPSSTNDTNNADDGQPPKAKRIACVLCRKRKLKCDGGKPACATCARLQHDCSYDEVRRKSGPKRGYVKALEARLAQVEVLLKKDDGNGSGATNGGGMEEAVVGDAFAGLGADVNGNGVLPGGMQDGLDGINVGNVGGEDSFPWELIGLGLDEPLPSQEVVDELNQAYFDKIHPSQPMIHRPRYYAAMHLAPHMRPPICLRYAMWAMASSVTDKYFALQEHFYLRARKYIQQDEMKGHGESMITVAHCQTWVLLCMYEFKMMFFPRAWMSAGRAVRHGQMMGLHRLDGAALEVKQCIPPPKDWTEKEERRRTFWSTFCVDRYSSIGTGWPMTIDLQDVVTTLPSDDDDYETGKGGASMLLEDALDPANVPRISSFGALVMMSYLFGRNLIHLHRPDPGDDESDLNGSFWKSHRNLDNIVLNFSMSLPDRLRLPAGLNSPNVVFVNMCMHTAAICLHQAAIFKADKCRMPARVSAESKVRCITAAAEITSIMRQVSHMDISMLNPFVSFCLYVAARVFVQYLKSRSKDMQVRSSLQFLLSAMHAVKRKNPLTESFLVQLEVDLEGAGLEDPETLKAGFQKPNLSNRAPGCPTDHLGMGPIRPINNERVTPGENGLGAFTDPNSTSSTTSASAHCSNRPAFGDMGLGVHTEPNSNSSFHPTPSPYSAQSDSFNYTLSDMNDLLSSSTPAFELPNRQRTPGSMQGSSSNGGGMYRSPQGDTGMSPDSTSNGTNGYSSHTSNTGYSPQNHHHTTLDPKNATNSNLNNGVGGGGGIHQDPGIINNMFPSAPNANATDFDMSSFTSDAHQQPQTGFVLPDNWTPGAATGLTPGGGQGMGDVLTMTDADWSSVMEAFPSWESGVVQEGGGADESMGEGMFGRTG